MMPGEIADRQSAVAGHGDTIHTERVALRYCILVPRRLEFGLLVFWLMVCRLMVFFN